MGSVSPLLAEIEYLLSNHGFAPTDFLWLGTKLGPERKVVESYGVEFIAIDGGKLRRYFSWRNFIDPWKLGRGYFQALGCIQRFRPDLVMTAGSYISVPVIYAARTLRKKILIQQLDLQPGLANRLMAGVADRVAVSWPELLAKFPGQSAVWVGTPVRKHILEPLSGPLTPQLQIATDRPLLLVMGGGIGAQAINHLVVASLPELLKRYQVVHLTGLNKVVTVTLDKELLAYYQQFEFVSDDLGYLLSRADVVICRAGIGTISEVLTIGKAAIVIPIPNSHQEINAEYFSRNGAIKMLRQEGLNPTSFVREIDALCQSPAARAELVANGHLLIRENANEALATEILKFKK